MRQTFAFLCMGIAVAAATRVAMAQDGKILFNGKPVANASVSSVFNAKDIVIENGRTVRSSIHQTTSNTQGEFSLSIPNANAKIIVLADEGFAVVNAHGNDPITLQPWSKVHFELKSQGKTLPHEKLFIFPGLMHVDDRTRVEFLTTSLTTDADGKATIERVFPTSYLQVDRTVVTQQNSEGAAPHEMRYPFFSVNAGEDKNILLADGVTATGHVTLPPEMRQVKWRAEQSFVTRIGDPLPDGLAFNRENILQKAAVMAKMDDHAGNDSGLWSPINIDTSGNIRAIDLPPGTYSITVNIRFPATDGFKYDDIVTQAEWEGTMPAYQVQTVFVVPEHAAGPIDMGPLVVVPWQTAQKGRTAPDFTFTTPDNKSSQLSDLRGHWVLLDLWATWCPPCIKEIPNVKTVINAEKDAGLLLLNLSMDVDEAIWRKGMEQHQLGGVNARPALVDRSRVGSSYPGGIPQIYLINPDGVIVARELRGPKMQQKVSRLMQGPTTQPSATTVPDPQRGGA